MKRAHVVALAGLAALLVAAASLGLRPDWRRALEPAAPVVKLRFACSKFLGELLPMVAFDKGSFKDEGLEVELQCGSAGWESLNRLLSGQADVATVAQLPLVYAALERKKYTDQPAGDFAIVADLTVANRAQAIIIRRDRGIAVPADLRGKRIALPKGTAADFFLDSVLAAQGIGYPELRLINSEVSKAPDLLIAGDVDRPPGPVWWYAVHFHQPGPGVLPSVPPHLTR